jgi:hypothetical protein
MALQGSEGGAFARESASYMDPTTDSKTIDWYDNGMDVSNTGYPPCCRGVLTFPEVYFECFDDTSCKGLGEPLEGGFTSRENTTVYEPTRPTTTTPSVPVAANTNGSNPPVTESSTYSKPGDVCNTSFPSNYPYNPALKPCPPNYECRYVSIKTSTNFYQPTLCAKIGGCYNDLDCSGSFPVCNRNTQVCDSGGAPQPNGGGGGGACGSSCPDTCDPNVPAYQACLYCRAACLCHCSGDEGCATSSRAAAAQLGTRCGG